MTGTKAPEAVPSAYFPQPMIAPEWRSAASTSSISAVLPAPEGPWTTITRVPASASADLIRRLSASRPISCISAASSLFAEADQRKGHVRERRRQGFAGDDRGFETIGAFGDFAGIELRREAGKAMRLH